MPIETVIFICVIAILAFSLMLLILRRYKRCPSDKVMVIYGKVGSDGDGAARSAKCIHGGAAFVWPVFQASDFLDLTPLSISVDLENALSRQNIRINVPSRFTVGISTETGVMQNAAERLLGLALPEIQELAKDIIFGQLRLVIATMDIEEINTDRDKFLEAVSRNVEGELKKIGLRLINVNVTDISDESGYIAALGKEAAAKAINDAKKSVAEQERDGSIGEANAVRDQRVEVAQANSIAIKGENSAQIDVAQSNAERREKEAESLRLATAAEKIQAAKALEEAYAAEQQAEVARSARERATQEADIIVKTEIEKRKMELEAEAQAEMIRRKAKGEADAIRARMEAEAEGQKAILMKQAEGLSEIVKAAGGDPADAIRLLLADKMEELIRIQVEAVKNIKIDKITVWDGGDSDGKTATAGFVSGLMKSVPPMNELFDMAGMNL
ncbi:MAG: flotillin family protein, partial [Oscillospiraceae bacterium]|nr:flotillin family protein [Oscillospiraceae bacterium]